MGRRLSLLLKRSLPCSSPNPCVFAELGYRLVVQKRAAVLSTVRTSVKHKRVGMLLTRTHEFAIRRAHISGIANNLLKTLPRSGDKIAIARTSRL